MLLLHDRPGAIVQVFVGDTISLAVSQLLVKRMTGDDQPSRASLVLRDETELLVQCDSSLNIPESGARVKRLALRLEGSRIYGAVALDRHGPIDGPALTTVLWPHDGHPEFYWQFVAGSGNALCEQSVRHDLDMGQSADPLVLLHRQDFLIKLMAGRRVVGVLSWQGGILEAATSPAELEHGHWEPAIWMSHFPHLRVA